jgi:hypothetical protein
VKRTSKFRWVTPGIAVPAHPRTIHPATRR